MTALLEGRIAIVTGAGIGLGRVFAEALAAEGAAVLVADAQEDAAQGTVSEIAEDGGRAAAACVELTRADGPLKMMEIAERELGPVDILVNNASSFAELRRKPALDISPREWEGVIAANLNTPFLCCRAVLPSMAERGYGKIVNVSSGSIFAAKNQLAHYVAAKMGVVGLTRVLAREYGNRGITVNAISPGATDTGSDSATQDYLQSRVAARSIQRIQVSDDLVGTLVFLSSSMSDFMTGQNLVVDGGTIFQ